MAFEIKVPVLPESVADATVLTWHKKEGDYVKRDEVIVELETDKVVLEVPSLSNGIVGKIHEKEGAVVVGETLLATMEEAEQKETSQNEPKDNPKNVSETNDLSTLSPAVRRLVTENDIDIKDVVGTGKDGRIIKEDIIKQMNKSTPKDVTKSPDLSNNTTGRLEKRVPMSRLRAKIAERLVESQQNTAMLTTFNEVNMQSIMDVRSQHRDEFEKKYGVRLGFMSFFSKAVCEALKEFPDVNASLDGKDVVYHGYYDIGIAVSTERGLVVPVLRNVDSLSMADIESLIVEYATRARENKLKIEEMQGGTFTITNGGVFGSLLSTPIINPPQTAILGMHKIQERAVVEDGQVVVRPMMYLALSYDHRLIDGKASVQFLVMVKKLLEEPVSLMRGL